MKILIFTEGTTIMHSNKESLYDYANYIPIKNAPQKIQKWQEQGAEIIYLTSRTKPEQIKDIQNILDKYNFPKGELLFRQKGEEYKDVAEKVTPDILIEDDCESIGGEKEMTYFHINPELKSKIKSIVVKEFGGIDHLTDDLEKL